MITLTKSPPGKSLCSEELGLVSGGAFNVPVAIDPKALLFRSDFYVKLTLPDPPPFVKTAMAGK